MANVFDVSELVAYPGVAAPPATVTLVADIVNGLVEELLDGRTPVRPASLKRVALEAAARPLRNPDGAQTITVQIDDYKETRIFPDGAIEKGASGVGFTSGETAALLAAITGATKPARSIRLAVPGFQGSR